MTQLQLTLKEKVIIKKQTTAWSKNSYIIIFHQEWTKCKF